MFNLGHSGRRCRCRRSPAHDRRRAPARARSADEFGSLRAVARRARTHRHRQLPRRLRQGPADPRLGHRDIAFADGIAAHARLLPGRHVIPVVDLSRRLARHEPAYLAAVEPRDAIGHAAARTGARRVRGGGAQRRSASAIVVGVSSGAAAIQLVFEALGIGPGDEVIVPAFTAVPTVSAVCATGATPVPVDVDERHGPDRPDRGRGRAHRTHQGDRPRPPLRTPGRPRRAVEVARSAAHRWRSSKMPPRPTGRPTGGDGAVATAYSFYPTKNVGGIGDGGAVGTADRRLAESIRRRRTHGMTEQYVHVDVSQNFRMSELEAAWLRLQLDDLVEAHATSPRDRPPLSRGRAATRLAGRPRAATCSTSASPGSAIATRVRVQLAEAGVATGVHYPLAITQQPAYRDLAGPPCPRAERWAHGCVERAVLPRAHRRRGRDRRPRPGAGGIVSSARHHARRHAGGHGRPQSGGAVRLGVLPLLQRRAVDLDDGDRRPCGTRHTGRRLRDHRRRRRVGRRLAAGARGPPRRPCPNCGSCATRPTAATAAH